ncbi:MAG: DNA polymerase III subunit gamma/tau [Gammaproteobacteria bacterium]|nr:DNA polymerase III subunit gamma/tau [Gammaproteobacteria bacterium]MDH5302972.1 DNA polymerase III subunit gamma/tau [Gammaproteobacteria bacterium]MDH5321281.1 DNA polymerase III subunit gamma/tau [Gammaproteobacteria bacterium]
MSYLVLARKWRPKDFSDTVGQDHVLRALTNALESGRLHHAYLFAGTRGVGKTTIARVLAKALNCETGITAAPCGKCSACREIDEGRFVDLIEVDAASRTKVDDTRDLLDNVQYAPARGRFKVYLIDEVHMLSKSSFNALLKTLEEPPPHVKFLLATTDPQKLPITVLSRCLQFNLTRLTPRLIQERLANICIAENVEFEPAALALVARAADGSLRDALSLLDQAIAYCGGKVAGMPVAKMLGTIDRNHVAKLINLLAADDAAGVISALAEIDAQFPDYARLLEDLARVLQQIAVAQVVGIVATEDEAADATLAELVSLLSAEDVQLFYQIALLGRRDLHLAPDPRSGAEMTLLRMLAFRPASPAAGGSNGTTNSSRSAHAESGQAAPAAQVLRAHTPVPARAAPVPWRDPDWGVLTAEIALPGAVRLLAANCAYLQRKGNTIFLSMDPRSESLLTKSRKDAMAAALSAHFGETLAIDIVMGVATAETPVQEGRRRNQEKLAAARVALESDPNIQALKDLFGAELKPETIEFIGPATNDRVE